MGLDITFYNLNNDLHSSLSYSYSTIHILRRYACDMIGAKDENSSKAMWEFPNLVWHCDAEGFYVGFLPDKPWNKGSQLWVGSVEGLYKELLRVQAHMLKNGYEGDAKKILMDFLKAFADIEYDPEENTRWIYIVFH